MVFVGGVIYLSYKNKNENIMYVYGNLKKKLKITYLLDICVGYKSLNDMI